MNDSLFGIPNLDIYLVLGILVGFGLLETAAGYLRHSKRRRADWLQEVTSFFALSLLIKPLIVLTVLALGAAVFPEVANTLQATPLWLSLLAFILVDDLLQYWYHRSAHEYPFLWKLHRTHHQAEEMGFFVSYRNAALYYLLMPNIWWVGIYTFLGGGVAVAIGLVAKQAIIISSHSRVPYDRLFHRHAWLRPIGRMWERIFITPAFHHAHHGQSRRDGISDPNGNFGNMLSIWDQLFGTASFPQAYPTAYGLENDPKEPWMTAYLYPLLRADDPNSELARGFQKSDTRTTDAVTVRLEAGQRYLYCTCGKSKQAPFCDSSHHGSKYKPTLFVAQRTGPHRMCNCKLTGTAPFCDGTHQAFTALPLPAPKR